jgi:zinc transporter ZupT
VNIVNIELKESPRVDPIKTEEELQAINAEGKDKSNPEVIKNAIYDGSTKSEKKEDTTTKFQAGDKKESFISLKNKKTVGFLILISSAIHNIMDGIAIGLVFPSKKTATIISSVVAIFLHEIPKELGDAGILFHSNFNTWGVLFWNSIINITGIIGTIIGLGIGSLDAAGSSYSLAYVAGNFLYISLGEMIPIILNKKGKCLNVIQFCFLLLGLFIMFMILLLE